MASMATTISQQQHQSRQIFAPTISPILLDRSGSFMVMSKWRFWRSTHGQDGCRNWPPAKICYGRTPTRECVCSSSHVEKMLTETFGALLELLEPAFCDPLWVYVGIRN
eukprot:scaffold207_cov73-Skeletonema_dohrnii-CCMP3373.AAC.1